jgi:hypothetical protein
MWLVDQGTANLPAGPWKTAFEFFASDVKSGSTTPDQAWQDWDNHLYYPATNTGSAPLAVERWYGFVRNNFSIGAWEEGMFAAGVLSHYYADINIPIHTGDNWPGHSVLEADINNHLAAFNLSIAAAQLVANPRQATIDAAVAAHSFYDDCYTLYPNEIQPVPNPLETNATFHDLIETQLEHAVLGLRNLWWTAIQGLEAPYIPGGAASWTILIDAGHNNVYTAPQDQLTAFMAQLGKWYASVVINEDELTASDLVDVDLVVITPSTLNFTATEISILANWMVNGTKGHLLVAAYSEHYRDPAYYPNANEQFQRVNLEWLLGNCTSHIRLNDDSVYTTGTLQPWYVDLSQPLPGSETFNITQGVSTIRNYSPCSLWFTDPTKVNVTVYGDPECYQSPDVVPPPAAVVWDDTNNGVGGDSIPLMVVEQIGDSRLFVSGTTFFSDFDYGATTFDNDVLVEHALEWLLNASLLELDVAGPAITGVVVQPATPVANHVISITATVSDPSGVTNVTLYYQVDAGTPQAVLATGQGGGVYRATIPAVAVTATSNITYHLKAFDTLDNWRKTMPNTMYVPEPTVPTLPGPDPGLLMVLAGAAIAVVAVVVIVWWIRRERPVK